MNICILKTNKYDLIIERFLLFFYFFHQLSFVFSASSIAKNNSLIYKFAAGIMIVTFLFIILADFFYFLRGKFSIYEIAVYTIVGIVFLFSFKNYRSVMLLANLFAISTFKNVSLDKALKVYIIATLIGILINLIFGVLTKYTGNITQIRYGTERIRYGLGFAYPTVGPFYISSIAFTYIVLKDKLKLIDYIWLVFLSVFYFIFTDTKAGLGYVILTLVLYIFIVKFNNDIMYNLFGIFTVISYPFFCIFTFCISLFYNQSNNIMAAMSRFVTNRYSHMHDALLEFGVKLFGQDVPIANGDRYHVDSSFMIVLINHGLIPLIICIVFMTVFSYIAYKNKHKTLLIALFMIAVRSMFDLGFMAFQFSPVVILFMPMLYKFFKNRNFNSETL